VIGAKFFKVDGDVLEFLEHTAVASDHFDRLMPREPNEDAVIAGDAGRHRKLDDLPIDQLRVGSLDQQIGGVQFLDRLINREHSLTDIRSQHVHEFGSP